MKRVFFLLIILSVFSFGELKAQFPSYDKHDISASYGLFGPDQFMKVESTMLNKQFDDKRYVRDNFSSIGNIFLTYRHLNRAETMLWGVALGYGANKSKVYYVGQYSGELTRTFYTLAAEVELRYVNKGIIQVYSGVGLGFTFGQETLSATAAHPTESSGNLYRPAFQLNVAGIRIGNKIAGFAEFGYGYKGIVNLGLSVQLF
jgi:hypothetical protein